jgi:hypothetical protein
MYMYMYSCICICIIMYILDKQGVLSELTLSAGVLELYTHVFLQFVTDVCENNPNKPGGHLLWRRYLVQRFVHY